DNDNDNIPNAVDNCPSVRNEYQRDENNNGIGDDCEGENGDNDNDGVRNHRDNCPSIPNADQRNQDHDAFGDVCDNDIDGDGI
ncbi:predicted protein, partial [Nematostella vectensis]